MFWNLFTKKKRKTTISDDEDINYLENDYKKRLQELKKEEKLRTLREKYEFEREKQQLELERLKLDLAERKAELFNYDEDGEAEPNQDLQNFIQMFTLAKSAGVISQTNTENPNPERENSLNSEPADFSQTNDFIKRVNNMQPEKYEKLKTLLERF